MFPKRSKTTPQTDKFADQLTANSPVILERHVHCISRKHIDPDALKVMYRLMRAGYKAYLVGGGVRDLLLGKAPKDFDVATDASPEEVRTLFRNSRIIGRRFRINHVYFPNQKIIEVATFRALNEPEQASDSPVMPVMNDNTYGDPQTDALRRDLTINGLFYDLSSFSVIDYVGGIDDLRNGIIRIIGDPEPRLREDPVRMIRCVRHAARTGFNIEKHTFDAICRLTELILLSPIARLHEEFLRDLLGGHVTESFALLFETGLMRQLLPWLDTALRKADHGRRGEIIGILRRLDDEVAVAKNPSAPVFLAAMLLGNLVSNCAQNGEEKDDPNEEERKEAFAVCAQLVERASSGEVPSLAYDLLKRSNSRAAQGTRMARRRKREGLSPLAAIVKNSFSSIGLTRREHEGVVELLEARYLILPYPEDVLPIFVKGNGSFVRELSTFLRIVATDESQRELAAALEQPAKGRRRQGPSALADQAPPKRRRTRSRNRRARNGNR